MISNIDNAIWDMIPAFIAFIITFNATIFIYQRKMTRLYKHVNGVIMEVGAMEFIIRQTEYRLSETNNIAKRMENVLQGLVTSDCCDEGQCDKMIHLLKEFRYVREANEVVLQRLEESTVLHNKSPDGS